MKNLNFFGTFLLIVTLSACSSGSSNEPVATTSSNTVPTTNNTTDAGTSTGPSNDQPSTTNNGTDEDGSNSTANTGSSDTGTTADSTGGSSSDSETETSGISGSDGGPGSEDNSSTDAETDSAGVVEGGTDGGGSDTDGETTSTSGTGSSGTDGGSDAGSDSGGTDTESGTTAGETKPAGSNSVINPDSALGQIQSRINSLASRTLLALNQSLSQGEMLTAQQEQCLGAFDPAIGEPLLSIDCEQPLATGEVAIFTSIASLIDTPDCRGYLNKGSADACDADRAEILVRTIFSVPETGRPQPEAGATLSYNIVQDRLIIENLQPALTGSFFCEYDLTNGNEINGDQGGNCYRQLNRIADLIDEHLAVDD